MKKLTLTAIVLFSLFSACRRTAPSLAWENFDPGHIDKKMSLNGPHGDYKVIFWQSSNGIYSLDTINSYTADKNWSPANNGDRDSSSMSWFYLTYHQIVGSLPKHEKADSLSYFNNGTLYTYTYITNNWIPGKSKITKNYVWVSADGGRMCALTSPEFAYFNHSGRGH